MTREEAIEVLQNPHEMYCDKDGNVGYTFNPNTKNGKAFEMAIKALEQETVPREHYEHEFFLRKELDFKVARLEKQIAEQKPCEDCVSRKAVLNLAKDLDFSKVKGLEHYKHRCIEIEDVEQLPPVTPDISSLREINKALTKRVKYLEDMEKYATPETFIHRDRTVTEFADRCKECGKQKKGKWICKSHGFPPEPTTVCSVCGFDRDFNFRRFDKIKFCPNCGAEMESDE